MDYVFQITSMDTDALLEQASRALERRTELLSRKQYPGLWKVTDRFRGKRSPEKARRRPQWGTVGGIALLALGLFAFVPGFLKSRELTGPLISGLVAILAGILLLRGRREPVDRFQTAARKMLAGRDDIPKDQVTRILFSQEEITISVLLRGESVHTETIAYDDMEYAIETADLFLLTFGHGALLLQKRDLTEGSLSDFRQFMAHRAALDRDLV